MKKRWLLAVIGLLALAGSAFAQVGSDGVKATAMTGARIGGVNRADSTFRLFHTDNDGTVYTLEEYPLSDQNFGPFLLISDVSASKNGTGLAVGAADSSRIVDTHRMRLGTLLIKAMPAAQALAQDTTTVIHLIVQIRTHAFGQADSNSTFAFYQYGQAPTGMAGGTLAATDTVAVGHLVKGGWLAPWSGEIDVWLSRSRTGRGGAELTPIAVGGSAFCYPNGIALPMSSLFGRELYSPWTSVRVRNAGGTGTSCDVQVWLVGSPL